MLPCTAGKPSGKVAEAIEKDLGGYDKFVEAFKAAGGCGSRDNTSCGAGRCQRASTASCSLRRKNGLAWPWPPPVSVSSLLPPAGCAAGATQFGSGWAWLSVNKEGKLEVTKTPNAENPWCYGATPILTMDVW